VDALKHVLSPLAHGPMSPDFSLAADLAVIVALSVIFVFAGAKAFERRG
jgi:putative exporter of polyketide antibiotics